MKNACPFCVEIQCKVLLQQMKSDLQSPPDDIKGVCHCLTGCTCHCSASQPGKDSQLPLIIQFWNQHKHICVWVLRFCVGTLAEHARRNCLKCAAHVCWYCETQMLCFVTWMLILCDSKTVKQKHAELETTCDKTHIQGSHVALHVVSPLYRCTDMHHSFSLLSRKFLQNLTSKLHRKVCIAKADAIPHRCRCIRWALTGLNASVIQTS